MATDGGLVETCPPGGTDDVVFGAMVSAAGPGRPIRELAPRWAAIVGLLASTAVPVFFGRTEEIIPMGMAGAAIAVALVMAARRAERSGIGPDLPT